MRGHQALYQLVQNPIGRLGFIILVPVAVSPMSRDEEATLSELNEDHLVIRSLDEVQDYVDPRIRPSDRPSSQELEEGYTQQLSDYLHHKDPHHSIEKDHEPLYVNLCPSVLLFSAPTHLTPPRLNLRRVTLEIP